MSTSADEFSHRFVQANGLRFHCAECGPDDGKLVVLLHGFPEFWWSWHAQMKALATKGYRVVAPDMRGYNLTDRPSGVASYRAEELGNDVAGIISAYGRDKSIVVGHDWGGVVAWEFAMHHSSMLERLVILNAPHPVTMRDRLRTWRQARRSWYIFMFQLPWLPERILARGHFAMMRRSFGESIPPTDIERYIEAAKNGGNLSGGINYYRAAIRSMVRNDGRPARVVDKPVLIVWGERDAFLGRELAEPPQNLAADYSVHYIPSASHWVQADASEEVSDALIRFFADENLAVAPSA